MLYPGVFGNTNRRSQDKLLVVDGFVPDKAFVMTGGRNISLSYYGINADGTSNSDTYLDTELLLRSGEDMSDDQTASETSDIYFSMLVNFKDNKYILGTISPNRQSAYPGIELNLKASLARLSALPTMAVSLEAMPDFLSAGYRQGEVRLAHEFGNLINKHVITEAAENFLPLVSAWWWAFAPQASSPLMSPLLEK